MAQPQLGPDPVLRLPYNGGGAAVVRFDDGLDATTAHTRFSDRVSHVERLVHLASRGEMTLRSWFDGGRRVGVLAFGRFDKIGLPTEVPVVCVGVPFDGDGLVDDDRIRELGAGMASSSGVHGTWCVFSLTAIRTTADGVSIAQRVTGADSNAWSTRGLVAHAAAGVRPRVNGDAAVDLIALDFVLGDGSLLRDATFLPPATRVDLATATEGTASSLEDSLPDEPPTPAHVRSTLAAAVGGIAVHRSTWIGLTAGRDSTLLVDSLSGRRPLRAITLGEPGWPDPRGAAATARRLGIEHRVASARRVEPTFAAVLARTAWTDGLQSARDLMGSPIRWRSEPFTWLTGNGGEVARRSGRYEAWKTHGRELVASTLALDRSAALSPRARNGLGERLRAAIDRAQPLTARGVPADRAVFVRERMRKWLGRLEPTFPAADVVYGYMNEPVLAQLLTVPASVDDDGSLFPGPSRPPAPRWRSRLRRSPPLRHDLAELLEGPPVDQLESWIGAGCRRWLAHQSDGNPAVGAAVSIKALGVLVNRWSDVIDASSPTPIGAELAAGSRRR